MKKISKQIIVTTLLTLLLSWAGCAGRQSSTEERVIRFGTFTQEERKEHIIDYLKKIRNPV